ncbi:tRNA-dependent cyclodipeptide synthase [Actinomadura sp. NAK00032]|uniref:tRNA-dependent cyclodipeptide synthase n=1 Tax=Actinomadura sp. NAK00032 TaxID=2742128 RepID=UPI001590878D|nr:tRNA-dependent cyclodipeptide synthase [Actinomadura sp. NAK00032]QKW33970.1 tRNA-dependent cyclodipeptide synthase [Actinomadura sp. NAK00032]
MYETEPLSAECARALRRPEHVCIGVSPFNSYFSTARLASLARWAATAFAGFHFFVPDEITAYTFEALGYPAGRARQKAHRQSKYTHNKIRTALSSAGVPDAADRVLSMVRLNANARYQELFDQAAGLFEDSAEFREACLEATRWVLEHKLPDGDATPEQLRSGVRYFLAELPMFAGSGYIVGASHSVFAYHQRVRFLERFFNRELEWSPRPGQGFLIVRPADDRPAAERPFSSLGTAR